MKRAHKGSLHYDDLIKNGAREGERSELFHAVVWHLAAKGWRIEQITDELAQHPNGIAAKYADRLQDEVTRSYSRKGVFVIPVRTGKFHKPSRLR
jgi:hypothetical protein